MTPRPAACSSTAAPSAIIRSTRCAPPSASFPRRPSSSAPPSTKTSPSAFPALPPPRSLRAAEAAHIREEFDLFPNGFETTVGERGLTLSGGQKQRTALARAILRNPRILILDDALASVDTYTEERILEELRGVMAGRTTILISHRISTVRHADRIAVLVRGRIAELGTHERTAGAQRLLRRPLPETASRRRARRHPLRPPSTRSSSSRPAPAPARARRRHHHLRRRPVRIPEQAQHLRIVRRYTPGLAHIANAADRLPEAVRRLQPRSLQAQRENRRVKLRQRLRRIPPHIHAQPRLQMHQDLQHPRHRDPAILPYCGSRPPRSPDTESAPSRRRERQSVPPGSCPPLPAAGSSYSSADASVSRRGSRRSP